MTTKTLENPELKSAVDPSAWAQLQETLRGRIINRQHPDYEEERKVYNGMINKFPEVIVKCRDVSDVITSVNFCREHAIPLAVRGGGHNAGGLGICDDGLVIDLALMRGIHLDLKANTVRAEGGCLLGDIDHATQHFGKAVPAGIFSTTGVAGLTLGGGLGHLSRKYGLTIDNLLEVDIVLADGSFVIANEQEHADLFWAIRGGGGNFGIVTSFLFKMQHVGATVYGGPMLWPIEDGAEVLRFYRDFILNAPNDEYCYFAWLTVPPVPIFPQELHLKQMCGVVWCNVGDTDNAKNSVDAFRAFKKPALDYAGPMPYAALQSLFDALYPKGLQWYWKAAFIKDLSDQAIDINVVHGKTLPTPHSTMHMYPINGACHNRSNNDTAFAYRDANWAQVIVGIDPDPINKDKIIAWARDYWDAIHPHSAGGAYVNFMMDGEGEERVKASYRENFPRLTEVKLKYDPQNLFRVNQNIVVS